jgi:hypothetical protein
MLWRILPLARFMALAEWKKALRNRLYGKFALKPQGATEMQ